MTRMAKSHKAAIIKEQNRRAEKKKLQMQKKLQEEDERRLRKEKRAALREEHRLGNLQESLLAQMIQTADLAEYTPKMRIYDVRDPGASNDGIILIGGFVGEIILTLTCLLDYILASPQNQNFIFNVEMMEQFINDLLGSDDCQLPSNIAQINVREGIEELGETGTANPEQACFLLQDTANLADEGLALILNNQKELIINNDIIESLFMVLSKFAVTKVKEHEEIPEVPSDAPPEKVDALNSVIEEIRANNLQIDIDNNKLEKMKHKISITPRSSEGVEFNNEVALVKLNNYRDENGGHSGQGHSTKQSSPVKGE